MRTHHLAVALCILSKPAIGQQDPLAWFPLHVGARWVYDHEWKSGDRNRPHVDRWTSEQSVTGLVNVPEGMVFLRDVKSNASDTHNDYLIARDREPYLVHANCIYVIGHGWDAQRQQLRPEYQKYLSEGALSPDFCFPLRTGGTWGNNDISWQVEPARAGVGSFLPAEYAAALHIFTNHFGSGGLKDVWFLKGTGVVGEHYIHHGTYDEYTKKLRSFSP